ncbi:MAG: hypothetical protein HPY62_07835 [Bacteroidales bacterium]|nr:hypothetical protein [Bacteroidales bacterium]
MQKSKRLVAIEKIIQEEKVLSQEELLKKLRRKGFNCTQATLSRNLREIGVIRIPDGSGSYRYALPLNAIETDDTERPGINMLPVIRGITDAKGLVLVKTLPGNANSTAWAIDNAGRYEIAGTVAGDDTILVIPRDRVSLRQVHACLEKIFPGLHEYIAKKSRHS